MVRNAMKKGRKGIYILTSLSCVTAVDEEPSGHIVTNAFTSIPAPENPG